MRKGQPRRTPAEARSPEVPPSSHESEGRRRWVEAALTAWGEQGLKAVAVEPLAERLALTKGSFYWHFKNRDELIVEAVELWAELGTEQVIRELQRIATPRERLITLFRQAWERLDHLRVEAAIGAAALTGDPRVRPTYERVQRRRLDYTTTLYRALGLAPAEARRRAVTTYGAFLGSLQIAWLEQPGLRSPAELAEQLRTFEQLLIPPARETRARTAAARSKKQARFPAKTRTQG